MSLLCRFTTVAALLLHLIFGCSLHHAAACGHRDHDQCEHASAMTEHVQPDPCCGHGDGCSDGELSEEATGEAEQLIALCSCESVPCDRNHPRCHGEVECSFVPSSDIVFVVNAPLVALVTPVYDPMSDYLRSLTSRGLPPRFGIGAWDPLSQCASLCTWLL